MMAKDSCLSSGICECENRKRPSIIILDVDFPSVIMGLVPGVSQMELCDSNSPTMPARNLCSGPGLSLSWMCAGVVMDADKSRPAMRPRLRNRRGFFMGGAWLGGFGMPCGAMINQVTQNGEKIRMHP